ncbi:MAG: hypothetical protein KGL39_15710 [Patescibacteria group bacterium]|nr:hypothetical protein [Patescibacteria group bacterium]
MMRVKFSRPTRFAVPMKATLPKSIPAGHVTAAHNPHLALARFFTKLAAMHQRAGQVQANGPDASVARLPRPDMAAIDTQRGRPLIRRAVIGSPNPATPQAYE